MPEYLAANLGKGWSVQNLKLMRQFYMVYSETANGESALTQSTIPIGQPLVSQFKTGIFWKHYILLMRIKSREERRFYEIEIANNGWSFREFERIFAAQYQTVLPSKDELRKLLEEER